MQEEGTSRPLLLFIRAVLVSQLFPLLIGREKHTASRGCLAELGVKQASMGSGLVTVHFFFSFGW